MEPGNLRALVTGASGFIGGKLAERLSLEWGLEVRAMVRDPEKAARLHHLPVTVETVDLLDTAGLRRITSGCDIVFHCAAVTSETGDWKLFHQANVKGTRNLVDAARQARISKFIHLSSVAVYGLDPPEMVDEALPCQLSGNPYADSKIGAEKEVWDAYHRGLPTVIVRPTNVYGPDSYTWTIRPVELLRSGRMFLVDGGTGICNHLYIDNLVDALVLAAKSDTALGRAYQITDGHPVTWREFFGSYAEMMGRKRIPSVPLWTGEYGRLCDGDHVRDIWQTSPYNA